MLDLHFSYWSCAASSLSPPRAHPDPCELCCLVLPTHCSGERSHHARRGMLSPRSHARCRFAACSDGAGGSAAFTLSCQLQHYFPPGGKLQVLLQEAKFPVSHTFLG